MLGTIKLRTYWRRVDSFEMVVDDLHRLRAHIVSETEEPIRIGAKVFRFSNGFTFFADSGIPQDLHFYESPEEVIALIDAELNRILAEVHS